MENAVLDLKAILPGMFTAKPVLSHRKETILQENIELTSHMINLLKKWKINSVCVHAIPTESNFERQGFPCSQTHSRDSPDFLEKYSQAATLASTIFEYMRNSEQVPYHTFHQLAYHDLYQLISEKNILANLYGLKSSIDYTYLHAVDVGIIAGLIGRLCSLEEQVVQSLILAGVMHDIGKSKIPSSILDKSSKRTTDEMDILKLHPLYGYRMVKNIPKISPAIEYGVLQHHERVNGSGYPAGLSRHHIHPFAKIIAIADVYDALTSNHIDRKSVTSFAALNILINRLFTHFDFNYCKHFIQYALNNLIGSTVILSDHSQGKVLCFDYFMSAKPVIQKADGSLLNLNQTPSLSIVEVVEFAKAL